MVQLQQQEEQKQQEDADPSQNKDTKKNKKRKKKRQKKKQQNKIEQKLLLQGGVPFGEDEESDLYAMLVPFDQDLIQNSPKNTGTAKPHLRNIFEERYPNEYVYQFGSQGEN